MGTITPPSILFEVCPMISTRPVAATFAALLAISSAGSMAIGQDATKTKTAKVAKKAAPPPPPATPIDRIKAPKGFKVELLYTVPRDSQGSWVNLTVDPKGRLITSDQYGKLYRVTPPGDRRSRPARSRSSRSPSRSARPRAALGVRQPCMSSSTSTGQVSERPLPRQGHRRRRRPRQGRAASASSRATASTARMPLSWRPMASRSTSSPATRPKLPELAGSLVPRDWGEDNLLPRMVDGRGFMTNEKAPGGYVCRVDPDGKDWELVSMGYRNAYDLAFNRSGDLFTFDSDMEWDMNTPWYRPTRVNLVASGADYRLSQRRGQVPELLLSTACRRS